VSAVDVHDLFRVYSTPEGDAAALQGLTLSVAEREVLVVLGPSGSGKSTLLRVLAGHERPSAGTARVFGTDLTPLSNRGLGQYRAGVLGYVEQHYSRSLDPDLTARDLVGIQLGLAGAPREERRRRADELLERVGLGNKRDARPADLSGGEQQRIAVCAALAHRPRLLLADEPTGELDAASATLVYTLIGELAREHGCTTVVVSHDVESTSIADRTVRVRDGRVSEEAGANAAGDKALVIGRGGWLRLPEELLLRAGIGERARAVLGEDGIVVTPTGAPPAESAAPVERADARVDGRVVAQLRGVEQRFGRGAQETTVLAGLDASFGAGRLVAVTGPSGSGKTTLLHLLAGLKDPTAGEVLVLGRKLADLDREERAHLRRESIAVIGQDPGLTPFLSARENVELALALRELDAETSHERALDALAAVGLAERAEQRAARLSAGERQRVAIARALAAGPSLLLADEPTARLDEANALTVGALFARLARETGAAVVCATHDPLVVEQADDEVSLRASVAYGR
jgi:ABC-type lipoprotein export system ATPase subunit